MGALLSKFWIPVLKPEVIEEPDDDQILNDLEDEEANNLRLNLNGGNYFLGLCSEIVLEIISYLDCSDRIRLSQVSIRFNQFMRENKLIEIINVEWNSNINFLLIEKFISDKYRLRVITKLDINDVYWLKSEEIRILALYLLQLNELLAAATQLTFFDLEEIIKVHKLKSLSFNPTNLANEICLSRDNQEYGFTDENLSNLKHLKKLCLLFEVSTVRGRKFLHEIRPGQFFLNHIRKLEDFHVLFWPNSIDHPTILNNDIDQHEFMYYHTERKLTLYDFLSSPDSVYVSSFPSHTMSKNPLDSCDFLDKMGHILSWKDYNPHETYEPYVSTPKVFYIDHPLLENFRHSRIRSYYAEHFYGGPRFSRQQFDTRNLKSFVFFITPNFTSHLFNDDLQFRNLEELIIDLRPLSWSIKYGMPPRKLERNSFNLLRFLRSSKIPLSLTKITIVSEPHLPIIMEWNKFADRFSNLTHVNISKFERLNFESEKYPYYCFFGLAQLKKLRCLSLPKCALTIISQVGSKYLSIWEKFLSSHDKNVNFSGLDLITYFLTDIEEFEIGFTCTPINQSWLKVTSLTRIMTWKKLKKLTIDNIHLKGHPNFLARIAQSCEEISSLRLSNLTSDHICDFLSDLSKAIPHFKNLKLFRLEQNDTIGCTDDILVSLKACKNLERIYIHCKAKEEPLDIFEISNLFRSCPRLFVCYICIASSTSEDCKLLTENIKGEFQESRPSLDVVICNSFENSSSEANEITFQNVHFRQLVLLEPQVGAKLDFPAFQPD